LKYKDEKVGDVKNYNDRHDRVDDDFVGRYDTYSNEGHGNRKSDKECGEYIEQSRYTLVYGIPGCK
jgi:hypothetical protein